MERPPYLFWLLFPTYDPKGAPLPESSVELRNVTYAIPGPPSAGTRTLLRDISLTLEPGTTTALLGRSGSGKTTLMSMVNAMAMPTTGTVLVDGRPTSDWKLLDLRRGIGYVIQETGLFPHWTVARNAGLALELDGTPKGQLTARVTEVLALAGLDPALRTRLPWQLSGGQRQRVGLARALAADPAILLMDEPFGALDPITRAEMQSMLKDLLARVATDNTHDTDHTLTRKTVLLVTHDLDEALFLAARIVFLEAGEIVADLPAREVPTSQNTHVKQYIAAIRRQSVASDPA